MGSTNDGETMSLGRKPIVEGRGARGKLRKPPSRRPLATPYARPPDNQAQQRRWLSKLVDPAYKLISGGANLIFPAFFSKSESVDDDANQEDDVKSLEEVEEQNASGGDVNLTVNLEVSSGQYFYPHAGHDVRSQGRGRMPDSMVPSIPNLSSYSGSCDFQELPNPKQFSASSRVPIEDTGSLFSAFGSRVPLMSSRIPSEKLSYQNQRNGANPFVSSKCASISNSALQHCLQGANFAMHSSDVAKAVFHHKVSDNEKVKDSSSLRGEWRSTNPANAVKLPDTNCQMPGKLASQAELSVSKNSSALSHQYPRVF